MISVGQRLRQAREKRGLTVQQVAGQTKISSRYIQAIEADDPKSLPGIFFYKSFVQQYAGVLGVPMEELRWELDRVAPPLERTIDQPVPMPLETRTQYLRDPEPVTSRLGFRLGVLLVMLVACSAVYAIWDKMQRATAAQVTQTPTSQAVAKEAAKEVQSAPKPAEQASSTQQTPLPPITVESNQTNQNASGAEQQKNTVPPAVAGKGSLVIAANELTWFRVTADGKVAFAGTLEANEKKNVDGFEKASIFVGNAGGLNVTFNGKAIGPIGPKGQVRTVNFTPDKFDVQAPVKKEADPDAAPARPASANNSQVPSGINRPASPTPLGTPVARPSNAPLTGNRPPLTQQNAPVRPPTAGSVPPNRL